MYEPSCLRPLRYSWLRRVLLVFASLAALSLGFGCAGTNGGDGSCDGSVAVLGCGGHDLSSVTITTIATSSDGLDVPRDLAFNPDRPEELWVVNRRDDGMVIIDNPGESNQDSEHIVDPYALHFMEEVSSIAFGKPGHFGTCQESRNTYNGQFSGDDFMGPTLWSSDRDIFGTSNQEAVDYLTNLFGFHTDLGSHLDMLHSSPNCMGIAWEEENVYWVFDGFHSSINRYDFQLDHGIGWDDHSDGIIGRYVEGEVEREADVPSHMELDRDTGLLYIADTGNGRIAVLDTAEGEEGAALGGGEPGVEHYEVDGGSISTLVDGDDFNLREPSGLELHDGMIFVSDNRNGNILAFSMDGELVDFLELGMERGALMGMAFDSEGRLYLVDAEEDEVLRIEPKES